MAGCMADRIAASSWRSANDLNKTVKRDDTVSLHNAR
jgi:hypothetical protein